MESFLFYGDYAKAIATDNLAQIIGNNPSILDEIQSAAVEECMSYLRQKYDVSQAFRAITMHDKSKTYQAGQTVYLDAPLYDQTKKYAIGVYAVSTGNVYKCKVAITDAELFNVGHWDLIGAQYAKYCAKYPNDLFDYQKQYTIGDAVFYNNKIYNCVRASSIMDHQSKLEVNVSGFDNIINQFPGTGTQWDNGTDYSVPTGTEITDTAKWSLGDGRGQKLLQVCIDVALYHAHARISPKNIPDLRTSRYSGVAEDRISDKSHVIYPTYSALGWLQAASNGEITPDIPALQPKQGRRIRFGGNQKMINQY